MDCICALTNHFGLPSKTSSLRAFGVTRDQKNIDFSIFSSRNCARNTKRSLLKPYNVCFSSEKQFNSGSNQQTRLQAVIITKMHKKTSRVSWNFTRVFRQNSIGNDLTIFGKLYEPFARASWIKSFYVLVDHPIHLSWRLKMTMFADRVMIFSAIRYL